jgi:hypothetical protein
LAQRSFDHMSAKEAYGSVACFVESGKPSLMAKKFLFSGVIDFGATGARSGPAWLHPPAAWATRLRSDQIGFHRVKKVRLSGGNGWTLLHCGRRFGIACVLIVKFNATTRRCFERSIDASLIFKSVFVLTLRIATSSARCWKVRPDWQRRFADDIALRVLDRLQAEHPSKVLKRNTFDSVPDVFLRPTVQAKSVLAPEPGVGRLLLHVLRQPLPCFEPNPLKARAKRYVNFRLRAFLYLNTSSHLV